MNVLVACEYSGRVRDSFNDLGHQAYSCDLLPSETPGPHHQGDVGGLLYLNDWDLIIAFPPCTHLASSGARWFKEKIADGRQQQGIDFFMQFANSPCPKVCIENPVGIMSTHYRKPDQIIQPYEYGDPYMKTTCLWLKGLPLLKPTKILPKNKRYQACWKMGPSPDRAKKRSLTYPGIAKAMATQWGSL